MDVQELARGGMLSLWLAASLLTACGNSELDAPKDRIVKQTEPKAGPDATEAFVTILQKSAGAPIRYELALRKTKNVEELGRWLVRTKQSADAAGVGVEARIYANNFTPHAEVARVLKKFVMAGIENVEFFGGDPAISKNLWPKSSDNKDR